MTPPKTSPTLEEYQAKRDFERTPEPAGGGTRQAGEGLAFVIQKHAASHLHFDLRLELEGVMKSWAVPKGPSLDPSVKRLAIEVEDHPMEYNEFEGTIPKGEYGGGTVMLWDRGTYEPDEAKPGEDPDKAIKRGYHAGKIAFTVYGERLRGSFALVRTRGGEGKPQWLLIKHKDEYATRRLDIVEEATTSVATGRTMTEIAEGKGRKRIWHSNRPAAGAAAKSTKAAAPVLAGGGLSPMLCQVADEPPASRGWTFEPKYDGIRVLAFATADAASLVTRNQNEKSRQFPDIVAGLRELAAEIGQPVVLDGEIVGLDPKGRYLRFESLQGRMHVTSAAAIRKHAEESPAAFVAFDVLLVGDEILVQEPWNERRKRLDELLDGRDLPTLRLGETSTDGDAMLRRGDRGDWEGIIAKRVDSPYEPGKRTHNWLKIKLENRQELVIGGWTEPRGARKHFGAILLGYYDDEGRFVYAGHTGTGFDSRTLAEMARRLRPLERKTSPFAEVPKTNEKPHWVTPKLVAEIKFNEWTKDGKLRQPVFLGFREDKDPESVRRERPAVEEEGTTGKSDKKRTSGRKPGSGPSASRKGAGEVVARLRAMRKSGRGGELDLGRDGTLSITNPDKVFFPDAGYTKGDLLAYYAEMAEYILPWMRGRPLVLKRYPNGIDGDAFYQQAAPDHTPKNVRVEDVRLEDDTEPKPRLVGGSLATLLYTIQSGAISYDPWHSRIGHLDQADYTVLDLDPGEGTSFQDVVRVARLVREHMDGFGLHGAIKTSGSSGIHVYLPLPEGTPLEAATLVAQILATKVAAAHPKQATVERMRKKRPKSTVYVDYLQNILGKTVAGVYAVRAKPGATVSTPLAWDELREDLDLTDFTIETVPERVREVGDLWADQMAEPNSLEKLMR